MMKHKQKGRSFLTAAAFVFLAALLLIGGGCSEPLVTSKEDIEVVNIVNQQLQDVFAPQLKGQYILRFSEGEKKGKNYVGILTYADKRLFFNEERRGLYKNVTGRCDFSVSDALTVENYSLTNGSVDLSASRSTRFYQDFLIPDGLFYLNNVDGDPLDLSQVVVDESRLEDDVYQEETANRLNAFFGLNFNPEMRVWESQMRGSYAIVFSFENKFNIKENLAALAELDQTEGLSVTGIYYGGLDEAAFCKPFRADDPINTETLDPRESLRVLAANQEIANMLLNSELYGVRAIDFKSRLENFGHVDNRVSASPLGACVVTDGSGFLSPEMFEAISKVCYRCLDVKLITDY